MAKTRHALFGRGIGYVDAHLLAAVRLAAVQLAAAAEPWTNDKRLRGGANPLKLAITLPHRYGS